ncbi:baseplate wedge subunit and tail pin [Vibrio phage nt-1]|uniref:Baseplate wedge subunit and tail pin n=1 Tax=Vibrio phage nt-1 TaxID=115992 RepID=R9TG08_9CAUD|nr:baseplate wedge subunit [Vibrio phage nt-1]AGN30018.1 baseplate wedge subunit and tail pin [Vibrio phage nt-1]
MKQTINVGQIVDDGTGDYLRQGGIKTRDNFDEIYSHLGDGSRLYAAGAWRTWKYASTYLNGDTSYNSANADLYFDEYGDGQGPELHANFGESWTIDTTLGDVDVYLPAGVEEADYGKAIRIRDVKGVWDKNIVTVYPDSKDSIKRVAASTQTDLGTGAEFTNAYQDLELVFTPPRHWEYVAQKYVNGLTFGDVPSVLRRAIISRQGQRDFNMSLELNGGIYNQAAVEVYRRGNLMYFGDDLSDFSDYGSIPLHTVEDWVENNPETYYVGDLVRGDDITGRDDRIWQCIVEHNSIGAWEETKWAEFADFPDYAYHAGSTAYSVGDIVLQDHDGYVQSFECLISHTSASGYTDLTADSRWKQLTNDDLAPLDGRTIRLRLAANAGDPLAMVTYLSDVSSFRSSYMLKSIKLIDENNYGVDEQPGAVVKKEFVPGMSLNLVDFGLPDYTQYNTETLEVLVNGSQLTRANTAGNGDSENGGEYDFDHVQDAEGRWNTIVFAESLSDSDIVTVRWYDNVIGTLLSWDDGDDNLQERTREIFVSRDDWADVRRFNKILYTDPQNPSAAVTEVLPDPETFAPGGTLVSLFESIFPVGSVYTNANNPNNPADYMGFGTWVRYAEGRTVVGWNTQDDGKFHRNNNNENVVQAGGTGGSIGVVLTKENIPELISTTNPDYNDDAERDITNISEQYSLVARAATAGGDINLNGCLGDPENTTPLAYYSEEPIKVNHGQVAQAVDVTQPYITAYTWIRTA